MPILAVSGQQGRHPGLASNANRFSFLIGDLLLGKLSETIVVQGNAPHDRPGFLVGHLISNRASFLCTKAPMLRVPETNFLHGITSHQLMVEIFRRSSYGNSAKAMLVTAGAPCWPCQNAPTTTARPITDQIFSAASLLADQQKKQSGSYQQGKQNTDDERKNRMPIG
jgi:hypothetical protein